MQWDYGDGPKVAGRSTVLFCAWLAWSRFRVVIALWDRTMPSVVMALDRALRAFGGAPTYALTDNEKTVSTDHIAGIAVRNPATVAFGRHYGLTVATCLPADPASTGKTFQAWNEATSSIPAPTQAALRTLEWIGRAENLVVCGPAGTGKTFLLEALGQAAVEAGRHVAWFTLEALGVLVRRHRADDSVTKAITRILRADLVIVDDIGLLPVGPDAAEGLYRLVDAAYERRSVAVSSNLHPSGFDELMPKTLATATVDRLLHHAHLCQTSGESVRLSQALTGAGVVALAGPR